MLKRKVDGLLAEWKRTKTRQGLLVTGARQVGKTTAVRRFARENYKSVLEVNFYENRTAVETVSAARDSRDLFLRLSALAGEPVVPGETLVFLDEIQECGDLLTWMKFLAENTGCDYVFSGSLLGLDSFDVRSLPVGFLRTIEMRPLDFEEFCWASGISEALLGEARERIAAREPVPGYLHNLLTDAFYKYLLVGGMPDAAAVFVERGELPSVRAVQQDVFDLYEHDIAKYVPDRVESRQIRMVYESVPGQLNAANKRFKYTRLGKNLRFANLETAFDWLGSAGVAIPVPRVTDPTFPLGASMERSAFKLYMSDVGLLTSRLMRGVDLDILNRKSSVNFGSIFENAAAQELCALGLEPCYYQTSSVGEIDFVVQGADGGISLCEIKSGKDYRRHSALSNLLSRKNYSFKGVYVFHDGNVEQDSAISYLPIYAIGLVDGLAR